MILLWDEVEYKCTTEPTTKEITMGTEWNTGKFYIDNIEVDVYIDANGIPHFYDARFYYPYESPVTGYVYLYRIPQKDM